MTEIESIEQFEQLALEELAAEEQFHEQGDEQHLCELDRFDEMYDTYRHEAGV